MTWSCDWLTPVGVAGGSASAWEPAPLRPVASPTPAVSAPLPETLEQALEHQLREAYEHGRAEGLREANAHQAGRLQASLDALEQACAGLHALQEPWQREAHTQVAALAVAVAQHVIEREVRTDPGIIADLVRQALSSFPLGEPVRIRIHPEDLSTLSLGRAGGELRLAPGRQAEWVADDAVSRGGCLVEGPRRVVDGRVRQALERIYEALIHA